VSSGTVVTSPPTGQESGSHSTSRTSTRSTVSPKPVLIVLPARVAASPSPRRVRTSLPVSE
jgi:hypothetical protein